MVAVIKRLVIANRGEIARRIMRAAKQRHILVAVVAPEDDQTSLVCREADAVLSVPRYLDAEAIVAAAKKWNADALHPGYGFLSENADFAELVEKAGIRFIGPTPENIRDLGSKEAAKKLAQKCNVPTLQALFSYDIQGIKVTEWKSLLQKKGLRSPYLVKASAGGGGRGMRIVEDEAELPTALNRASEEAKAAFKDGTVFIENYLRNPRHIEIQVFGDGKGNGIHWGERECSLQRRHQKVIEEAPSPVVSPELRKKMGAAAVSLVKETEYRGAGTVEFLLDETQNFYFLEVNTRLQVEHPVTEMVYGIDLVQAQFDLCEGKWPDNWPSPLQDFCPEPRGVALEARILAEDPSQNFLPSGGKIHTYHEPHGTNVRIDSGVCTGSLINTNYDSMIGKLIVWGHDRLQATDKFKTALSQFIVHGPTTNTSFLLKIAEHPDFLAGQESTSWIANHLTSLNESRLPAYLTQLLQSKEFAVQLDMAIAQSSHSSAVSKQFGAQAQQVSYICRDIAPNSFIFKAPGRESVLFFATQLSQDDVQVSICGETFVVQRCARSRGVASGGHAQSGDIVKAPMAGKVLEVLVKPGDSVTEKQILFVMESMKMQLEIRSPASGKIDKVCVDPGAVLSGPQTLATFVVT